MKDRIRGAIVGVAIGDALGMPVEGLSPKTISDCYGWINSYRTPKRWRKIHKNLKRGQWTDDTQLTIAIAESIIRKNSIDYNDIAGAHIGAFQSERRGVGPSDKRRVPETHRWGQLVGIRKPRCCWKWASDEDRARWSVVWTWNY